MKNLIFVRSTLKYWHLEICGNLFDILKGRHILIVAINTSKENFHFKNKQIELHTAASAQTSFGVNFYENFVSVKKKS